MRIVDVEAFALPYVEPNDHGSTRYVCLVKITADDGAVGWGEAVTLFKEATDASVTLVNGLRDHLVGVEDTPAAAGSAMTERMWWYGVGGIGSFVVSAVDTALWDLEGRRRGLPLVELLGGPYHSSLPVLTSGHASLKDLGAMADLMASWVADAGSEGVKVGFGKLGDAHLGFEHARDVEFVEALRTALGAEPRIMIDIGARLHWTIQEAIARTRAFEEFGIDWIEEPLGADNPDGYAELKAATTTRIAYGEREWTARSIERIVRTGTVDVVGIDPGRAEGVSGFRQAAILIHEAGREANAHAFAGPISYAASLALSLASPACRQLEVPPYANELYDIVGRPEAPTTGRVMPLLLPGLGFDIDEESVRAHASR